MKNKKDDETNLIPREAIESRILLIRGKKVMIDKDLATLYGVEIKVLNQAVKRDIERFPDDFMFQLTKEEYGSLRSQFVTLKRGQHRKYLPYVFSEQGVAMLSSVLNSKRAIQVNIQILLMHLVLVAYNFLIRVSRHTHFQSKILNKINHIAWEMGIHNLHRISKNLTRVKCISRYPDYENIHKAPRNACNS